MADAMVSAVMQQLTAVVYQEIGRGVTLVVDVRKEAQKLKTTLQTIQAVVVDAERRQVKEEAVKLWLDELKSTSYDMDDLLDEWNTCILKSQIVNRKVCFCIPSPWFCFNRVALNWDFAVKIKDLKKRLQVIAEEKNLFSFDLNRGTEELVERPISTSFVDVYEIYGRDLDKGTVISMLLAENSQEALPVPVISVVGRGGIGKTTLAQLAYNDQRVKAYFDTRIWVYVSDPFDEIRVAKAILEALTQVAPSVVELETLLQKIHQSLERKKFLLVLDDVWTEDSRKWESLKHSLKCGSPGSKILITTRKENVANIMGSTTMFPLGQLSEEECWKLFSQVAYFGRAREDMNGLEDIGRKIANKCRGLPLAAKILGGLLRFKKTKEQWQSVLDSELWELEEAEKDTVIQKDKLIRLWMAQASVCLKKYQKRLGQLIRLRYLKLSNNHNLLELPETLCDLYNLQTLDLTRCRSLMALPLGIGKLVRHLDNRETSRLRFMPKGLERSTCLRTLKELVVSDGCTDNKTFTLGNLANLIHLGGDLKIRGLGNVTDLTEAMKAKLCNKKDLSGLTLCFDFNGRTCSEDVILEALQPPPQLERIEIRCFKGPVIFPSWLKSASLSQLRHVILGHFRNW
ncbi:Disease resistance protein [Corchorus capsularis]|uniref:Disease resistance protein n=1 Tax=Corchorus capsularis TaxID=210143 RepID=A0A1R3JMS2_COCAP|nr:Disease resistance protein [Corchorus capsularis]